MRHGGGDCGGGGDCKFPARSPGRLINFFDEMREEANWTELRRWCGVLSPIGQGDTHH